MRIDVNILWKESVRLTTVKWWVTSWPGLWQKTQEGWVCEALAAKREDWKQNRSWTAIEETAVLSDTLTLPHWDTSPAQERGVASIKMWCGMVVWQASTLSHFHTRTQVEHRRGEGCGKHRDASHAQHGSLLSLTPHWHSKYETIFLFS